MGIIGKPVMLSGSVLNSAILHIQAPAESIVTISKGNITKTSAGQENIEDPTIYDYQFIIYKNWFDQNTPWTITATKQSESSTDFIIINTATNYNIRLYYYLYIIKNGIIQTPLTMHSSSNTYIPTIETIDNYAWFQANYVKTCVVAYTSIDISNYSTIHMVVPESPESKNYTYSKLPVNTPSFGISNKQGGPTAQGYNNQYSPCSIDGYTKYYKISVQSSPPGYRVIPGDYSLDISEITGTYDVAVGIGGGSDYQGQLAIKDFYLIPS